MAFGSLHEIKVSRSQLTGLYKLVRWRLSPLDWALQGQHIRTVILCILSTAFEDLILFFERLDDALVFIDDGRDLC